MLEICQQTETNTETSYFVLLEKKIMGEKNNLADISGAYIPGNVSSFKSKSEHIKVILKKKKQLLHF